MHSSIIGIQGLYLNCWERLSRAHYHSISWGMTMKPERPRSVWGRSLHKEISEMRHTVGSSSIDHNLLQQPSHSPQGIGNARGGP